MLTIIVRIKKHEERERGREMEEENKKKKLSTKKQNLTRITVG